MKTRNCPVRLYTFDSVIKNKMYSIHFCVTRRIFYNQEKKKPPLNLSSKSVKIYQLHEHRSSFPIN